MSGAPDRLLDAAELAPVTVRRVELVPRLALTPEEAADAIGVSRRSFYEHVAQELRVVRRGRLHMYPVRELERWLDQNAERVFA